MVPGFLLETCNKKPKDQQEKGEWLMFDITDDKKALSELQELAEKLLQEKTPAFERQALIRGAAIDSSLSLRDGEIYQLIAKARAKLKGTSSGELPNQEIEIPEESWLCEQLFAERTLNIVTALQKVGKSAFASAFLGCLTYDSKEFLGHKINCEKGRSSLLEPISH